MASSLGISTLTAQHKISLPLGEYVHPHDEYPPGTMLGNYFYIKNKSSGVEPGFMAICLVDDQEFCDYVRDREHLDESVDLQHWLATNHAQAQKIAYDLEQKGSPLQKRFTRYLIKQDYPDPDSKGRVTIPLARAMNSNTVKAWGVFRPLVARIYSWFRKRSTSEENKNALLESIGNDIAKQAYQMQCQEQTVIFGSYPNHKLKILTRGKWDFGIQPLGEIHGGKKNQGNYLADLVDKKRDPSRLVDSSVTDLGEYLIMMLVQGDVDGVGSKAQNKFKKQGKLFGLDFGQVYRGKNPALDTLQDDFSFVSHGLKNFSIFTDTPLREKMKGGYYLQKLLTGKNPSPEVLTEYGEEFQQKIEAITKGKDLEIFDSYIDKLKTCSAIAEKEGQRELLLEYNRLIAELERSKVNAKNANSKVMQVFTKRLTLTPSQLDLLEAFEKLTSKTALTSQDGSVILNQMRVVKRVPWEMKIEGDRCVLTTTPQPLTWYQKLSALFSKNSKSQKIEANLLGYLNKHPEISKLLKVKESQTSGIAVEFNKNDLTKVKEIFNEEMIQQEKHPKVVRAKKELQIIQALNKPITDTAKQNSTSKVMQRLYANGAKFEQTSRTPQPPIVTAQPRDDLLARKTIEKRRVKNENKEDVGVSLRG